MDTLQKLEKAISTNNHALITKLCSKLRQEKILTHIIHKTTDHKVFGYLNHDQYLVAHWDFDSNLGYAEVYIGTKEIEMKDMKFSSLKAATAFVKRTLKSYGYILAPEAAQRKDTVGT